MTDRAERPCGAYTILTILAEDKGDKVKVNVIRPGQRISYQRHSRRFGGGHVGRLADDCGRSES